MRHQGSSRVEYLTNQNKSWLLIVGLVALIGGIMLVLGAALPGAGVHTAEVSASARRVADRSVLERGGGGTMSDSESMMASSAAIAATSDIEGGISTEVLGPGARGAVHAGDRSPFAVSSRIDLRLDLMETLARRWRPS
jgi:hypothetical protein